MKFARIDSEIQSCERHLAHLASLPPEGSLPTEDSIEVEAFLTRYLLISIYAEFEQAIQRAVSDRAAVVPDVAVRGFVTSAADSLLRRINVSDLAGFLGRFDDGCKGQFQDSAEGTHQDYVNLLQGRHQTAHGSGSQMTFKEVSDAYSRSVQVLQAFEDALAATIALEE